MAAVGGASGPLYGTAFIEAGVRGPATRPTLDAALVAAMLEAAADGLARRGRCAVGDKTILDTLAPAADAFAEAVVDGGADVGVGHGAAVRGGARAACARPRPWSPGAAWRCVSATRSAGHLDPGAVSCLLLLRALGGRDGPHVRPIGLPTIRRSPRTPAAPRRIAHSSASAGARSRRPSAKPTRCSPSTS